MFIGVGIGVGLDRFYVGVRARVYLSSELFHFILFFFLFYYYLFLFLSPKTYFIALVHFYSHRLGEIGCPTSGLIYLTAQWPTGLVVVLSLHVFGTVSEALVP